MKITEFLNLNTGEWFSQRTNYHLHQQTAENSKANLTIELIEPEKPQIVQLCQENKLNRHLIVGSLQHSWDNSVDWGKPKQQGSALILFIPDDDCTEQGKIIQTITGKNSNINLGSYLLKRGLDFTEADREEFVPGSSDYVLTLRMTTEQIEVQERLWFASDNLRLRTTIVKEATAIMQTFFYSEIRKMSPKTQPVTKNAATKV
jgi:hypothetical protein